MKSTVYFEIRIMDRSKVLRHLKSPFMRRKVLELPTYTHCGEIYIHQGMLASLLPQDLFRNILAGVSTLILDEIEEIDEFYYLVNAAHLIYGSITLGCS